MTSKEFSAPPPGVVNYFAVKAYNSASPRQYSPCSAEVNTGLVINRAPTLVQPTNQTSAENASISLQLVASDPDGNPLTYTATGLPASLTVNATTGLVSGTLTSTSAGSYTVTATVSDGALSNSRMFTWTVTDVVVATPVLTWPAAGTVLPAGTQEIGGTVRPVGAHTLGVTFTTTDTTRYTTATASTTLVVTVPRTTPVLGTADFNGDGKPDILWRHATTGEVSLWYMDDATRTGGGAWLATVADLNWKIGQQQ